MPKIVGQPQNHMRIANFEPLQNDIRMLFVTKKNLTGVAHAPNVVMSGNLVKNNLNVVIYQD